MSLQSHLAALRKKHSDLETQISELERAPSVDHTQIAEAKKRKLALKDEIAKLE